MLKQITDRMYAYNNGNGTRWMLKYGDRGVYGFGKSYWLYMMENGNSTIVAEFCVKDDGYGCKKSSVNGKVWTDMKEILNYANDIIVSLN